jgi:histidine triad (HIT) family protein
MPTEIIYQDDEIAAFHDLDQNPPVHILVVPRKHIPSLLDLTGGDVSIVGKMTAVANRLAADHGVADSGYRLVINCGKEGGQIVPHLHLHLLGGRTLKWSP